MLLRTVSSFTALHSIATLINDGSKYSAKSDANQNSFEINYAILKRDRLHSHGGSITSILQSRLGKITQLLRASRLIIRQMQAETDCVYNPSMLIISEFTSVTSSTALLARLSCCGWHLGRNSNWRSTH